MYDYKPPRSNFTAQLLMLGMFLLIVICFAVSAFVPTPVIPQTIGLVFLLPLIQLISRFVSTRFLYRIVTYEDGKSDLDIYSYRGGSHMQLVCRVGLEEITAAKPLTDENRKRQKGMHRYNYSPDLFPKSALVLSITNGDGDCEVLLCPDEKMTRMLTPSPLHDPAVSTGNDAENPEN